MKKILIVDDEQEIRDILQLLLECEFENEVILAESGNKAIKILQEQSDEIGVILSDYNMPDGNGGLVYQYNCEHCQLPFLLVTGGYLEDYPEMEGFLEQDKFQTTLITKPFEEELLFSKTHEALAAAKDEVVRISKRDEQPEFVRVNIELFVRRFMNYNVDLFLRLKGGKVIQIFTHNDEISKEDILKYKNKGEKEVFFKSEDFVTLKNNLVQSLMDKLSQAENVEEAFAATGETIYFVTACLDFLGVTQEQVALVHRSVDACLRVLEKNGDDAMNDFFSQFQTEQGYLAAHSLTTLHLCYMMMRKGGFFSKENMDRLAYAAILHDFEHYNYDYASILDQDDKFEALDQKGKDSVLNHMYWAQEKVGQMSGVPEEVGNIILVHHEQANGSGFPRGVVGSNFTVLQACFILALRTAHFIYFNHEDKQLLIDYVGDLADIGWSKGPFKKPFTALQEIIA